MALVVKNPPVNAGNMRHGFDPWVGKVPWRRVWWPTPVFLPGESHGQGSLVGYSLWGHEGSKWLKWLSTHIINSGVSSFPLGFVPMSLYHPLPFEVPSWDFPGSPVIKTPCFQCRGCGCDHWVGKLRFHMSHSVSKKFCFLVLKILNVHS